MIFQENFNSKIIWKILILFLFVLSLECKKHRKIDETRHHISKGYKRSKSLNLQEDPLFESTGPTDSTEIGSQQNLDSSGDVVEKTSGSSIGNLDYNNEGTPTSSNSFSDASPSLPSTMGSSYSTGQSSYGGESSMGSARSEEPPTSPSNVESGVATLQDTGTQSTPPGGDSSSNLAEPQTPTSSTTDTNKNLAGSNNNSSEPPITGVQSNLALGDTKSTTNTTTSSGFCANCTCGDCNSIEISLPLACLKCPHCSNCTGGKTPCIDPGCISGDITIEGGECAVEKIFHQCCNTFLANLNEMPPCNVFNTNNCKIGNQRLHDNKAMNYLLYVQTNEPFDEQFNKKNSDKVDKLRDKIQNFFLRVYADNDFFLDVFGITFSNVSGLVNAKILVRFTKEVKGNIHLLFKAIMCDCGCYLFKASTLRIDVANTTDLIDFCPKKCKYPSAECLNPAMSNCDPSCCVAMPVPKLPEKSFPAFNFPQMPFMKPQLPGFFNPMPPPPPPPPSNYPLLCDPNCSVFCSQMCPPMCCNTQFNFKRSRLEEKSPEKHAAVNFFQRNYNL